MTLFRFSLPTAIAHARSHHKVCGLY